MDIGKHLTFMAQGANGRFKLPNIEPKAGMIWVSDKKPDIIFMAVVDGWIMMKKKGRSIPFVYNMLNFTEVFIQANGYKLKV